MPKPAFHPHPKFDVRCADCEFWHPLYVENLALQPNGQAIKLSELIRQGVNTEHIMSGRFSQCFYNPAWVLKNEEEYCSHFSAAKKY